MGTQILRPQDCLTERNRFTAAVFPRQRNCSHGNSYTNPRINRKPPSSLPQQRRPTSELAISKRSSSDDISADITGICRGESSLDPKPRRHLQVEDQVKRNCDIYAGIAFAVSPEPSSLPLPSFSKKKDVNFDDNATRDLRRLLRLD